MNTTSDSSRDSSTAGTGGTQQLVHDMIVQWLRREGFLSHDRIDYDASIFELGIDSLGIATIACQLEEATNKKINPEIVYEMQTINELANYLDILPLQPDLDATGSPGVEPGAGKRQVSAVPSPVPSPPGGPLQYYEQLNSRVRELKEDGRYFFETEISEHDGAWVVANGQRMLMFGSYEYLGLLGHPHLKQAAIETIEQYGTGHHGVRLLAGTTTVHRELEAKLASFMAAEDAITFSSGYVANLATISALVGRGDCVIGDQWNHASIVDGCRMSNAEFFDFRHNDMGSLAEHLERANGRRTLVVVDAVFSMDGDIADMPGVVELCRTHNALLMVDEAHSLGVLGSRGRGIQEHFDLDPNDIDVKMGTLSKTLAGCGGFVAGREVITTYLRHHARGYIFSGALPAGQARTANAALEVIEQNSDLVARLWENVHRYASGLQRLGFDTGASVTPIVPVMTRSDAVAIEMTRFCRSEGLFVVPVSFPAVPMDAPRLRTCVSAVQTSDDIDFALEILARAGRQAGLIG